MVASVARVLVFVAAWILSPSALAQSFRSHPEAVLSPQPGVSFASLSVGAPTVAYDSIRDRFLMAFEAKTPTTHPDCPQGVWAIGLAHSPDGIDWTIEPDPIVVPTPGSNTYYSCVAAHPAAVFHPSGDGALYVLFKAEEDEMSCLTSVSTNCPYTGIGGVRVGFDAAGDIRATTVTAQPVLPLDGPGGHPSFVVNNGRFAMLYQRGPHLYRTTSSSILSFPTGTLTFDASAQWNTASAGEVSPIEWVQDEFKSPSVLCDDSRRYPYAAFVGSVETNFGTVESGAWSKSISAGGVSWELPPDAFQTWSDNDDWRHWDMLRLVSGDYLVWYSKKNVAGFSEIHFGGTTLQFDSTDAQSRICN